MKALASDFVQIDEFQTKEEEKLYAIVTSHFSHLQFVKKSYDWRGETQLSGALSVDSKLEIHGFE